jgi:hypothetical protein
MTLCDPYPLILASLPRHGGDLFAAKRPPISRIGLEKRLLWLSAEDQLEIDAIEGLLSWDRAQRFTDDAALLAYADAVLSQIRQAAVCAIVRERFALRSIVAALRARHAGEAAPAHRSHWGRTDLAWRIERSWSAPGFGLAAGFAWVRVVDQLFAAGDSAGAERVILGEIWRRLARSEREGAAGGYLAVVLYVLRWNVIDRWVRYEGEAARARFCAWTEHLAEMAS